MQPDFRNTTHYAIGVYFNPKSAELQNLNFNPLEGLSRYRNPQLWVGENYSLIFNLRPNFYA